MAFGSLQAFFENPSAASVPSWDWMRTVTKEQAADSRARLLAWAERGECAKGGALGDWLFAPRRAEPNSFEAKLRPPLPPGDTAEASDHTPQTRLAPQPTDTPSLTPGAIQRNWRTPTEFPRCPATIDAGTLDDYLAQLQPGIVFARNRYGESRVEEAGKTEGLLSVVCRTKSGVKDWSAARVFIAGDVVCHESGGTFFTKEGAMKAHLRALGVAFDEALYESIDDYA